MRHRSKSKATLDKADKALQNWFRRIYPDKKCEVCFQPFQVMHHHLEKSKSNAGRFNHDNLVFLCHRCHSKIIFGNHNVVATYSLQRGAEWLAKMKSLAKVQKQYYTKRELENIIEKYEPKGVYLTTKQLQ